MMDGSNVSEFSCNPLTLEKKFNADPELTRDYVLRLNGHSDIVMPRRLSSALVRGLVLPIN